MALREGFSAQLLQLRRMSIALNEILVQVARTWLQDFTYMNKEVVPPLARMLRVHSCNYS